MKRQTFLRFSALALTILCLLSIPGYSTASNLSTPDEPPERMPAQVTGTNFWTWSGPAYDTENGEAPEVSQIVIDPSNPDILYAGTDQGVYRSTDGGENWAPRNGGLGGYGDLVVTGIAIDPTDSQTLIISTWGYGLLRSTDSGMNWTRLPDPLDTTMLTMRGMEGESPPPVIAGGPSYKYPGEGSDAHPQGQPRTWERTALRGVTINPADHNEIFACVGDGNGLYRSTDGGNSWTKIELGSGSSRTYTFAPSNNQIRYASFGSWSTSGGFYRTTNGGTSWQEVGQSTIVDTVTDVAIDPGDPNIVLAATSYGGIYRSTDGGDSWTQVGSGLSDTLFFSIAFAPSNPDIAYAGGYSWAYRSTDGGATWANADSSFPTGYVEGLAIHPSQPDTVWIGANLFPHGGVYKRTNSTNPFVLKASGMERTFVLDLEQDPSNPDILYAATWGGSVFRSDDGGLTWDAKIPYAYGDPVPYVYSLEATQGPTSTILYAGSFYSNWGVLKSFDRGDTWFEVSRDYPSYISFDIESIYGDPDHLVAATHNGMQYSFDGGENWYGAGGLDEGIVLEVCEFPDTGRMLAATYGGGLFYSWGGYSWYEANTGVTGYGQYTYDVACSPDTPGLAYAGSLGVYRTTDYGENWHSVEEGLPNDYFRAIDIVPGTGDVFAGSHQNGVYVAHSSVPIWSEINTGLVEQRTRSMKVVDSSPVHVFAGTNGQGAWDYTLTDRLTPYSIDLPLVASSSPIPCGNYEPNNSFSGAHLLPGPGNYCEYLSSTSDQDIYRLDVNTLGPITIDLTDIPPGMDYDLELYDNNLTLIDRSLAASNDDEHIAFQPRQTGNYYVVIYPFSGSDPNNPYHLSVSYNGPDGGMIYGTVTENGIAAADTPITLRYYNGHRTTNIATLTDNFGIFRFRGMASLPIGHTYTIYYPNDEWDSDRLAYWYCPSFTDYQAGDDHHACSFDVENVDLLNPAVGETSTFPITFEWSTRGIADEIYVVYLRSYEPSYAYHYSPYTPGGTYTLSSLPSGFTYGDTNYWSVNISNDNGYGASYFMRQIYFSSTKSAGEGEGEPIPNCDDVIPETNEKPGAPRRFSPQCIRPQIPGSCPPSE